VSTDEEIREVYESDISKKSNLVFKRQGILPFIRDGKNLSIESVLGKEMTEDLAWLAEIFDRPDTPQRATSGKEKK